VRGTTFAVAGETHLDDETVTPDAIAGGKKPDKKIPLALLRGRRGKFGRKRINASETGLLPKVRLDARSPYICTFPLEDRPSHRGDTGVPL
jgi:hypothetical protein